MPKCDEWWIKVWTQYRITWLNYVLEVRASFPEEGEDKLSTAQGKTHEYEQPWKDFQEDILEQSSWKETNWTWNDHGMRETLLSHKKNLVRRAAA